MDDCAIGIEVMGIYDGALFWFNEHTLETELRFEPEWYTDRGIPIGRIMSQFAQQQQRMNKVLENAK